MRWPRPFLAGVTSAILVSWGGAIRADEIPKDSRPLEEGQGPFTQRNQFLLNLLFLAFPQREGTVLPLHSSEALVTLDYANTFVGSDVFFQLVSGSQRTHMTPFDLVLAQLAQPNDDLFFVDTEQARTTLTYRWGALDGVELDLEVPFISYLGGVFDPVIEGYHRATGLGNAGREFYEQNIVQLALTLGGDTYFSDRSPSSAQIGDVSLIGRFRLLDLPRSSMALSVGLKLPTGNPDTLGGSGSSDQGLDLEETLRWGHQRLHLCAGWIHTGSWALFPDYNPSDEWSFGTAYEYARSARLSWIGQLQTQSSVFRSHAHSDGSLADYSTEILAGARWQGVEGRWNFQAGMIENIFDPNNGVDIGLLLGFGVRMGRDVTPSTAERNLRAIPSP